MVRLIRRIGDNLFVLLLSTLVFIAVFLIDLDHVFWNITVKTFLFFVVSAAVYVAVKANPASQSDSTPSNNTTNDSSEGVVFLDQDASSASPHASTTSWEETTGTDQEAFQKSVETANLLKPDSKTEIQDDSTDYDIRSLKAADVENRLDSEKSFRRFLVNVVKTVNSEFEAFSSFFFLVNHAESACVLKVNISQSENFFNDRAIFLADENASVLKTVVEEKCPVLIGDLGGDEGVLPYYTKVEEVQSVCLVPILMNKVVVGLLGIDSKKKSEYDDQDVDALTGYATLIEEFVGNVEQVYKCENVIKTMASLFEISERFNASLKTDEVIKLFSKTVTHSIEYDRVVVSLKHPEQPSARIIRVLGDDKTFEEGYEFGLKGNLNGSLIKTKELVYIRDLQRHHRLFPRFHSDEQAEERYRTFYGLPLLLNDRCVGAVSVESKKPDFYDKTQRQFLVILANMVSQALERSALYDQLSSRAERDGLTNVFNHRTFRDRLKHEIERAGRSRLNFSLLMIDIDHFKSFNDSFGHSAGDDVLRKTAKTIQQSVRKIDPVARYGGEEFAVILIEQPKEEAMVTAERIRANVESTAFEFNEKPQNVTVSLGVAEFGIDAETGPELIHAADQALYQAKDKGRNCVVPFEVAEPAEKKGVI